MRRPAYEPSPQVKPVVHSPFGIKLPIHAKSAKIEIQANHAIFEG